MLKLHYSFFLIYFADFTTCLEKIEENDQKEFSKRYNDARWQYARGELPGFSGTVPIMMEAMWNESTALIAQQVVKQLCSKGSFEDSKIEYHDVEILHNNTAAGKSVTVGFWAESFHRETAISRILRPEFTEIGCAVSSCHKKSYAACVYGKKSCSTKNCEASLEKGQVCSKCPEGSKCTLDGLCSRNPDAVSVISKMGKEIKMSFVYHLSRRRTEAAVGLLGFEFDENLEPGGVQFEEAANMMEVTWSSFAEGVAESSLVEYCSTGSANFDRGEYQLSASYFDAKFYKYFDDRSMAESHFSISNVAWPMILTDKYRKLADYSDLFSWTRSQMLTFWAETTEIGCVMEYCRGAMVVICAHGKVTCKSNCTVYKGSRSCAKCPTGTACSLDLLCTARKAPLPKISEKDQRDIVDRINQYRSSIAKGERNFTRNEQGELENGTFPTASNMKKTEWTKSGVQVSEQKIGEHCKFGPSTFEMWDNWQEIIKIESIDITDNTTDMGIPLDFLTPSEEPWQLDFTKIYQETEAYNNRSSEKRRDIMFGFAGAEDFGCSFEYCAGQKILLCVVGVIECFNSCKVYNSGPTCSSCPKRTVCNNQTGLCELAVPATTKSTIELDYDRQLEIEYQEQKQKELNNSDDKGNVLLWIIISIFVFSIL